MRERLNAPVDVASVAALRALFGLVMAASIVRYFAEGWIDRFFIQPTFHFHHVGWSWVQPLPGPWMYALFAALFVAALCVALGLFYRAAAAFFFVGFQYLHLIDVSNYLNHYYLVGLLSLLFCLLPLHRAYSVDAWRRPELRVETLPAWILWLLRFQVALVYVFAALGKVGPDWLLHGQPLGIWLSARTDTFLIGRWLDEPAVAVAMSWAGFLYDLTIVGWLSWRRSRPFAFAVVCVFHAMTHLFFQIGIFPFLMTAVATVFFDPSWPRALWSRLARVVAGITRSLRSAPPSAAPPSAASASASPAGWRLSSLGVAALAAWVIVQLAVPLRSHAYAGDVLWHEQGMRWSWRVMVREKNGDVSYRVRVDGEARERRVSPSRYLNPEQELEFAGEPDLVLQLAHRIRDDFARRGHRGVEVRADAWVSLNGRPSARMIDPAFDLARVEDGWAPATWILPAPEGPPIRLRSWRERVADARSSLR